MRLFASFLCTVLLVLLGSNALRAESSSVVEIHKQLKQSDDHTIKLLSNRLWSLIERQAWTDTTGKFSVNAKFVSYDEEKATVTLLASRGRGAEQVEKEITVPLEKLDKQSQARAKRIVRLLPKLEEKLAEVEAEDKEEENSPRNSGPRFGGEGEGLRGSRRPGGEAQQLGGPPPDRRPPPRNQTSPPRRTRPPMDEELEIPAEGAAETSVENPYGGTKWIGRDQLVEDRRMAVLEEQPRPGRMHTRESVRPLEPEADEASYAVEVDYNPNEFPNGDREDWQDYYEPFGDESHMEVRWLPEKPRAGETTRLMVITSSIYGRPKPKAFVRIGDNLADPEELSKTPDAGPTWIEMKLVGGRIMDLESEEMVPLGETPVNFRVEQPGESYYLIGLNLPEGKIALDIKLISDLMNQDYVAFRLVELEVAAKSNQTGE